MSWLNSLLLSLSNTEFEALNTLKLKGQEKKVFDVYVNNLHIENKQDLITDLAISETHLYKISSILLKKIANKLSDNNEYNFLVLLKEKTLYPLLKNEINLFYKKSKKVEPHKKNKEYLLNCFWLLIDIPNLNYDEKLVEKICEEYLSLFSGKELIKETEYLKLHKIFALCNRSVANKNPYKLFKYNAKDLIHFEKELIQSENYLALYYLYRTFCSYYTYYEKSTEKNIEYLKKAIQLKDKIKHHFPIDLEVFLNLLYADALLLAQNPEEAFAIYNKAFKKEMDKKMYGYFYHCEQYCMLSIQLKDYSNAKKILVNYFAEAIAEKKDVYATRGLLVWCKLNLTIGNYKEALGNILEAKRINDKSVYLPFDVQLRVLETFCFFFKNDLDFTKQLCQRNIKYIQSQENSAQMLEYVYLFKIILNVITFHEKNKSITQEIVDQLIEIETIFKPLFGNLITLVKNHIYNKKNNH